MNFQSKIVHVTRREINEIHRAKWKLKPHLFYWSYLLSSFNYQMPIFPNLRVNIKIFEAATKQTPEVSCWQKLLVQDFIWGGSREKFCWNRKLATAFIVIFINFIRSQHFSKNRVNLSLKFDNLTIACFRSLDFILNSSWNARGDCWGFKFAISWRWKGGISLLKNKFAKEETALINFSYS